MIRHVSRVSAKPNKETHADLQHAAVPHFLAAPIAAIPRKRKCRPGRQRNKTGTGMPLQVVTTPIIV
jgi:hypothetical protein